MMRTVTSKQTSITCGGTDGVEQMTSDKPSGRKTAAGGGKEDFWSKPTGISTTDYTTEYSVIVERPTGMPREVGGGVKAESETASAELNKDTMSEDAIAPSNNSKGSIGPVGELVLARTPFGVNRYLLLMMFCLYSFMTGVCYWGWNGIQDMLYKSGAFQWKCPNTNDSENIVVGNVTYVTCAARRNAIGDMYTVAFACHFGFSVLAGVINDVVGGKICSILGLTMTGLGWVLLGVAGSRAVSCYFLGVALIGAGADTGNIPLLSLGNLFPRNESLVLSILGSVRSCSFAVPVILSSIYNGNSTFSAADFSKFCYGYVGVGVGTALAISVVLIPQRPFKAAQRTEAEAEEVENREADARGRRMSVYTGPNMPPVSLSASDLREIIDEFKGRPPHYEAHRSSYSLPQGERRTSMMALADTTTTTTTHPPHPPIHSQLPNTDLNKSRDPHMLVSIDSTLTLQSDDVPLTFPPFFSILKDPRYFVMVPFFCLCLIRTEFFPKSNKELLLTTSGRNAYQLFSIFNILSFLPGPIFGKLCDQIGIIWVILILNVDGILIYFFVLFDAYACKVLAVLFFFIYASFVLSNLYCYVAAYFPTEHFGKLTGLASFLGGMFTLLSIMIYRMSTGEAFEHLEGYRFAPACGIMMFFGVINMGLWLAIQRCHRPRRGAVGQRKAHTTSKKMKPTDSTNTTTTTPGKTSRKTEMANIATLQMHDGENVGTDSILLNNDDDDDDNRLLSALGNRRRKSVTVDNALAGA